MSTKFSNQLFSIHEKAVKCNASVVKDMCVLRYYATDPFLITQEITSPEQGRKIQSDSLNAPLHGNL